MAAHYNKPIYFIVWTRLWHICLSVVCLLLIFPSIPKFYVTAFVSFINWNISFRGLNSVSVLYVFLLRQKTVAVYEQLRRWLWGWISSVIMEFLLSRLLEIKFVLTWIHLVQQENCQCFILPSYLAAFQQFDWLQWRLVTYKVRRAYQNPTFNEPSNSVDIFIANIF